MNQKKYHPKVEFDQTLFKKNVPDATLRPASGKQIPVIKSPLPPRKPILSQHQKSRQITQEPPPPADYKIFRTRSITPSNQKNLPAIKQTSPIKIPVLRPTAASEKRIQFQVKKPEKQQFKITTKITMSAEKKSSKSQHDSPNWTTKQFTWINQDSGQKRNKARDKLYKKPFEQSGPKCVQDFAMTAHKNELPQLLEMYQQQFKDILQSNNTEIQVPLNMSEIQEMNEEGLSSMAQSTLQQQFF